MEGGVSILNKRPDDIAGARQMNTRQVSRAHCAAHWGLLAWQQSLL